MDDNNFEFSNIICDEIFSTLKLERNGLPTKKALGGLGKTFTKLVHAGMSLFIATSSNTILKLSLESFSNSDVEEIEIVVRADDSIENLFIDESGTHLVISSKNGENFYMNSRFSRPVKLSKLNGFIESVSFGAKLDGSFLPAKSFLVGTSTGRIYEIQVDSTGKQKASQLVHQLEGSFPITSLHFYVLTSEGTSDIKIFITFLSSTQVSMRLHHFFGGPTFQQLFVECAHLGNTSMDFPGSDKLKLKLNMDVLQSNVLSFTILTRFNVCKGSFSFNKDTRSFEDIQVQAQQVPYVSYNTSVADSQGVISTSYHFLILLRDRIQILSRLGLDIEQEVVLKKDIDGSTRDLYFSSTTGLMWLLMDSCVFQICFDREDRNIWKILLNKANHGDESCYDQALDACDNRENRILIIKDRAQFYLRNGECENAALQYSGADIPFDDSVLSILNMKPVLDKSSSLNNIIDDNRLRTLRFYLIELLGKIPKTSKSQRTMLCTWLVEIILHQILDSQFTALKSKKEKIKATRPPHEAEADLIQLLKEFLRMNRFHLDQVTIFNLLSSRPIRSMAVFYSQIVGDYDKVVSFYLQDQRYTDIIKIFQDAPFEKIEATIYKICPILIEYEPESTIEMLSEKPKIQMKQILPSLLRYATLLDKEIEWKKSDPSYETSMDKDFQGRQVNFAIKYLWDKVHGDGDDEGHRIVDCSTIQTLVWFLAKYFYDDSKLDDYMEMLLLQVDNGDESISNLDREFILRICKRFNRSRSVVTAYLMLGMEVEAVLEALKIDLDLAKFVASKCLNLKHKKDAWMQITAYLIQKDKDAKRALNLLNDSEGIVSIEDLLPILPETTEIDLFKIDICQTLENSGAKIEMLKREMNDLSESAESISMEVEGMRKRGFVASKNQKCETCRNVLCSGQFYLFPCSHGYHSNCLRTLILNTFDEAKSNLVKGLEDQLSVQLSRSSEVDKRTQAQIEYLQNEIDGYIAADCPLCGYVMIEMLSCDFLTDKEIEEIKLWEI